MQLESHLLKKKTKIIIDHNETKLSDKGDDIEDDSKASPAKVILQEGTINSLDKYTNKCGNMKKRKNYGLRKFGSAEYNTSIKASEHFEFYEKTFTQFNDPLKLARINTFKKTYSKAHPLNQL